MDEALKSVISILNHEPLNADNINFKNLFQTCTQHRINGQVQLALKKNYPREQKLLAYFREHRRPQQYQSIKQAVAAVALYKLAQDAGKAIVFLKGLALSQQLYQDISVRLSHDIDVLVQSTDVFWFDQALKACGYQPLNIPVMPEKYKNIILRTCKDIPYYHPIKKITLELHWQFSKEQQFSNFDYNTYVTLENPEVILVNNAPLPVLPKIVNFIYLSYHAEKHYCERLHWMYDTLLYSNKIAANEWEMIFEFAKKNKVKSHLHYLICRWKTFFPFLSRNIPTPLIKKIWLYPETKLMFNKQNLAQKNIANFQKIICRLFINKSFRNAIEIPLGVITENYMPIWIKYRLPVFLFYFNMPLWIVLNTVQIANRTWQNHKQILKIKA